jgi:hypothetical protein
VGERGLEGQQVPNVRGRRKDCVHLGCGEHETDFCFLYIHFHLAGENEYTMDFLSFVSYFRPAEQK